MSDAEAAGLAKRLGIPVERFVKEYTHQTAEGRSLIEKRSAGGLDCIFLDRQTIPGKAICSVYEDRPIQCKTWPFWPSIVKSETSWRNAKRTCPGMDTGKLYTPVRIRVQRDEFNI